MRAAAGRDASTKPKRRFLLSSQAKTSGKLDRLIAELCPNGVNRILQHVNFEELKSGEVRILDTTVEAVPLTSLSLSLEIADTLKKWIEEGKFLLTEPVEAIPSF